MADAFQSQSVKNLNNGMLNGSWLNAKQLTIENQTASHIGWLCEEINSCLNWIQWPGEQTTGIGQSVAFIPILENCFLTQITMSITLVVTAWSQPGTWPLATISGHWPDNGKHFKHFKEWSFISQYIGTFPVFAQLPKLNGFHWS